MTQHTESELSLCLRYSKTSCRRQLKNPFKETVNCQTVTLERKNGLWKLLSVTLYCKSWCRLNTPCQSGVVSECGYMFWRMRESKALKKDHHYIINIVMVFILIIAFTIDGVMDVLK